MRVGKPVAEYRVARFGTGREDAGPDLGLRLAKNDSATALSKRDPVRPIDGRMFSRVRVARNVLEGYCLGSTGSLHACWVE